MKLNNFRSILFKKELDKVLFISKKSKCYFTILYKDSQRAVVCMKSIISDSLDIIVDKIYYYLVETNSLFLKDKQEIFKVDFPIEEIHILETQDNIPIFVRIDSKTFSLKLKELSFSKDFRKYLQDIIFESNGIYDKDYDIYIFEEPLATIYKYIEESRD